MVDVYLGLGSNLGDREKNITRAIELLKENVKVVVASSLYNTEPVDNADQPWFLNQVVRVQTDMSPVSFHSFTQSIEKKLGKNIKVHKGPRTIDIDILLFGETVLVSDELTIPHPRLEKRAFVLIPLCEIAPQIMHPVLKEELCDLEIPNQKVEKLE